MKNPFKYLNICCLIAFVLCSCDDDTPVELDRDKFIGSWDLVDSCGITLDLDDPFGETDSLITIMVIEAGDSSEPENIIYIRNTTVSPTPNKMKAEVFNNDFLIETQNGDGGEGSLEEDGNLVIYTSGEDSYRCTGRATKRN